MESLDWSNHHHHHHNLEDNMSLFMPVISNNANVLSRINNNISNNIGGNKPEDQHHQQLQRNFDAFIDDSTILFDHHHHPQTGPILDSRASDQYNAGLEGLKPGTMSSFGSLDCLISASNSHTDTTTSIEDEGISILFSDCNSLLMNSNLKQGTKCKEIDSRTSHSQEHVLINNNNVDQSRSDDTYNLDSDGTVKRKRLTSDQNLHIKSSARTSQYQNLKFLSHNKSNHSTTTTQVTSDKGTTFQLIPSDDHHQSHRKPKRQRLSSDKTPKVITTSSNISFQQPSSSASSEDHHQHHEPDTEAIAQMKEMIYRAAAFRPVDFELEAMEKPKRKNVKISNDPQTVAARQRRERISERIRVLQRLVPGGTKMDTASMLDEAANYLRFLRSWVKALESLGVQQQIDHLSMMNNNLSSPSGVNADHSGNVGYVNHHFSMHNQQPQFSISNPSSSVHPSTSGEQQYCHI